MADTCIRSSVFWQGPLSTLRIGDTVGMRICKKCVVIGLVALVACGVAVRVAFPTRAVPQMTLEEALVLAGHTMTQDQEDQVASVLGKRLLRGIVALRALKGIEAANRLEQIKEALK